MEYTGKSKDNEVIDNKDNGNDSSGSIIGIPLFAVTQNTTTTTTTQTTTPSINSSTVTTITTNPCALVRHSCFLYVKEDKCQTHVTINKDAIPILAQQILEKQQQQQQQNVKAEHHLSNTAMLVEWDEEDWHYSCQSFSDIDTTPTTSWPPTIQIERMTMYILALDAINFCFWRPPVVHNVRSTNNTLESSNQNESHHSNHHHYKYEYEDLAQTLTNMARSDHVQQQEQIHNTNNSNTTTSCLDTTTGTLSSSSPPLSPQLLSSEFLLSPMNLQNMTLERMNQLFQTFHPKNNTTTSTASAKNSESPLLVPPFMEERCRIWNEIGTVLMNPPFYGSILPLFQMVQEKYQQQSLSSSPSSSKASIMVQLLIDYFPNFRDDTTKQYNNYISSQPQESLSSSKSPPLLYFYKRAQICVGDLNAALTSAKLQVDNDDTTTSTTTMNNDNMDEITTFADYRVPQLLRHSNIIQYSTKLAQRIDTYEELVQHSDEEYAIRASTIVAVELLVQELRHQQQQTFQLQEPKDDIDDTGIETITTITGNSGVRWNAMQTDWYLWQLGEKMEQKNELLPHHRVRTTFY